jgi:rod shape-determining protein MreB
MAIVETCAPVSSRPPRNWPADIVDTGIVITGGGGLLRGLDRLIGTETQLAVTVAQEPDVLRGPGESGGFSMNLNS